MADKLTSWTMHLSKMATTTLISLAFQIIILVCIFHAYINTGLWWFNGLIGFWAIPQICGALKLEQATFKIFESNIQGGKAVICEWLTDQKRCMYLDLGFFVVLLVSAYAFGIGEIKIQTSPFAQFSVGVCMFLVVCTVIRLFCLGMVLCYNELLETVEADATQKKWGEVFEETV